MASYNTVITNEGAALLASVIANQGTLTFSEMRFSTTDYDGVEATLTVGTFAGVFITAAASASVVDSTTIKVDAQFDNSGIVGDHPLYSIGLVGTDGNTTALIAVCTTTAPDIIRPATTGVSTYAFNINLTVSSTSDITVVGTTAGVLYDVDVVDSLNSTATDVPLAPNMGRVLEEQAEACVNVYGAKNLFEVTALSQTVNDVVFTINADKSITTSGQANAETYLVIGEKKYTAGTYTLTGSSGSSNQYMYAYNVDTAETYVDTGSGVTFTLASENTIRFLIYVQSGVSATETYYPMLRDARIVDDTFVPYAQTNKQLTDNKAERSDITTIQATGSTNSTGSTITAGTYFYLNGSLCICLQDIGTGATFTLNTNYKVTSANDIITVTPTVDTAKMPTGSITCKKWGKICQLRIYAATFTNEGDAQIVASDLPKPIIATQGFIGGSSSADTALIYAAGTVAWVQDDKLYVSIGTGDASRNHYIYVTYITT